MRRRILATRKPRCIKNLMQGSIEKHHIDDAKLVRKTSTGSLQLKNTNTSLQLEENNKRQIETIRQQKLLKEFLEDQSMKNAPLSILLYAAKHSSCLYEQTALLRTAENDLNQFTRTHIFWKKINYIMYQPELLPLVKRMN